MYRKTSMVRLALAVSLFMVVCHGLDAGQRGRMQKAVQAMLGFRADPKRGAAASRADTAPLKPAYMLKLYERFKQSRAAVPDGNSTVNTVRSIQAHRVSVKHKRLLAFNLSSVLPTEDVLRAQIHIFKRKRKRRMNVTADLHELRRRTMRTLGNWPDVLAQQTSGWKTYDVTSALKACLSERRGVVSLALSFSVHHLDGKVTSLSRRQFARHMMRPFLVVFSNDAQNISLDQLESHFTDSDLDSSFVDPETGVRSPFLSDRQRSPEKNARASTVVKSTDKADDDEARTTRSRRSIHNNEIPKDAVEPVVSPSHQAGYNLPETHPIILQGRTQFRERLPRPRIIPYPDDFVRRRRRRKHRKYRRQRKRNQKYATFPLRWAASGFDNAATENSDNEKLCQRRKLVVDFADIGWREWIISPKSFEANYCAGSCSFPMTRKLRPSNHATIQSLVQAVGISGHVPAPCCVPDSLSSVTLLYFDEGYNVVLKNYPDMSVQSCGCR